MISSTAESVTLTLQSSAKIDAGDGEDDDDDDEDVDIDTLFVRTCLFHSYSSCLTIQNELPASETFKEWRMKVGAPPPPQV